MKYFLLLKGKTYIHNPYIRLPYGIKKNIEIREGNYSTLEKISAWRIEESGMTFFPDVLVDPLLLIKENAKNVIQLFEPKIKYKQVMLLGDGTETAELYYLPLLPLVGGKWEKSGRIRIEQSWMLRKNSILMIQTDKKWHVLVNIEIAEVLLKKRITGIELQNINITDV